MANFFDQFDPQAPPPQGAALPPPSGGAAGNFFDKFDSPAGSLSAPLPSNDTQFALTSQVESSGKVGAVNPNSRAAGLVQFTPATAKQYGLTTLDLVNSDPTVQQKVRSAFDQFTADNTKTLSASLGRAPTPGELYLAHQQGATGAAKLLADPKALARDVVGLAAVVQNGGSANMTAGDFAQLQEQRISLAANAAQKMPTAAGAVSSLLGPAKIGLQPVGSRGSAVPAARGGVAPDQVANALGNMLVGAAHGGIDTPLNSAAEGAGWLLDKAGLAPNRTVGNLVGGQTPSLYDTAVKNVDQENQLYNATEAANSVAGKVGNIGGGIASAMIAPEFGLAGKAGFLANAARGAIGGAAYGAEQNSATNNTLAADIGTNAAVGAAGGAVLPYVARGVGSIYSHIFGGGAKVAPEVLPAAAAAQRIEPTLGQPAAVPSVAQLPADPVAAARVRLANFKALGLEGESGPTLGMVGRDPTQFQIEQDTAAQAGKGQPLVQRFQNVNAGLKSAIDDVHAGMGATATTPYEAGKNAATALTTKWQQMQSGSVSPAYAAVMRPDNVLAAPQFNDLLKSNPLFPAAIKAVRSDPIIGASVEGMPDASLPVLDLAKRHLDDIEGGAIKNGATNRARVAGDAAKELTAKLDIAFPGYADARAAAEARFGEFDRNTMAAIQKGSLEPDDVLKRTLWNGKVADVNALKNALLTGTPEQIQRGTAAWNDLRGQTMDRLIAAGFGENGAGKFSPHGFNKEIKILTYDRLSRIFTPDEMTTLNRIRLAGSDAFSVPAFSAPNYSHSGTFLANEGVAGLGAGALRAVNKVSNVAGAFVPVPHTLVTRPLESVMEKLGAKSAMNSALSPSIQASVAAAARLRAGQQMAALLQRLPLSRAAAAIYSNQSR